MPPTATELKTKKLTGVEVLAVGTWKGDDYTTEILDGMVAAFNELKGRIDPPGKLGHDDGQKLAQADGYPAIGWVDNLYRDGEKLKADFRDVPAKVADLIEAKAYDKISSEVYFDREFDGKVYPHILTAVSFLGADAPAVKDIKSISDVAEWYRDIKAKAEAHYTELPTAKRGQYDWGDDLPPTTVGAALEATIHRSFTDRADSLRKYSIVTSEQRIALSNAIGAAMATFLAEAPADVLAIPITGKVADSYYDDKKKPNGKSTKEDDMDQKVIAKALGLAEDADEATIMAKLAEAGTPAPAAEDPKPGEGDDRVAQLTDEVKKLREERAAELADNAIKEAIADGRMVPAQRDALRKIALSDPATFADMIKNTPKHSYASGPIGNEGGDESEDVPTPAREQIQRQLGTTPEMRELGNKPTRELMDEHARKVNAG